MNRLLTTLCPLFLAAGCLEHDEKLQIRQDGSVLVEIHSKGDQEDLENGPAAMPSAKDFAVERFSKAKDDGGTEFHSIARREFAALERMPKSFSDDAEALRFENKLTVRKEKDRTVYVFTRSYRPRAWALYQFHHDRAFPEPIRELTKDWEKRSEAERTTVIQALLDYERAKNLEWLQKALENALTEERAERIPEAATAARKALAEHFAKNIKPSDFLALIELPKEEQTRKIAEHQRTIEALLGDAASAALGLTKAERADLIEKHYRSARRDFEVSEDLGDENFKVRVEMPGAIISDNGDGRDGNAVTWSFSGTNLRDRTHRLMAVSEVRHAR